MKLDESSLTMAWKFGERRRAGLGWLDWASPDWAGKAMPLWRIKWQAWAGRMIDPGKGATHIFPCSGGRGGMPLWTRYFWVFQGTPAPVKHCSLTRKELMTSPG